ncbi:MAG: CRISPR-associated endonuclease Cas2 [Desulfurococcaceae archaeon]
MVSLRVLVVYDIGDNTIREEFARKLQQLGLERIQRSCFLGRGGLDLVKTVARVAERLIDVKKDVVHVFPLDEYSFKYAKCVGRPTNLVEIEGVTYVRSGL